MQLRYFAAIAAIAAGSLALAALAQTPSRADQAPAPPAAPATAPAPPPVPVLNPTTTEANGIKILTDIAYTSDNDYYRSLNVYEPAVRPAVPPPLIVLIHGGGWIAGDKKDFGGAAMEFVRRGYVAASLSYRLTGIKGLPIPIYDCKSAIRFLRAHAAEYGFDPNRIVVGGHSAGGHLSEFLAASNGVKEFDQGEYLNVSSDVQAAYCMAGVADVAAYMKQAAGPSKWDEFSPVHWISKKTAPMFIIHGEADTAVPVAEAVELHNDLDKARIQNELHLFPGEGHGSPKYMGPDMLADFDVFLAKALKLDAHSGKQPPVGKGLYKVVNMSAPDLVLDAAGPGSADGAKVDIDTPTGTANQKWSFEDKGNGVYAIHPSYDKTLSVAVANGASDNQTPVVLEKDQDKPSQRWLVIHYVIGDLTFFVPQCAPYSALEDFAGRKDPGSQLDIWGYGSGDVHQQWRLSRW